MLLGKRTVPEYREPVEMDKFPTAWLECMLPSQLVPFFCARWLLHIYTIDVYRRLPQLLAAATSIYGSILKMDSTKKVCKKLQGHAAGTATWVTNVGNERGEVLVSILTDSEGLSSLSRMAQGLMGRYVLVSTKLLYSVQSGTERLESPSQCSCIWTGTAADSVVPPS